MIVSNLNLLKEAGTVRAEATIAWEAKEAPPFRLFVQAEDRHEDRLWPDPNAFLVACILSAWDAGERRVRVEGALCPTLCQQIKAPIALLDSWYPNDFGTPPVIESTQGVEALRPFRDGSACLLSCGIDSLGSLRANLLQYPPGHPAAVKAGILIAHQKNPAESREALLGAARGRLPAAREISADAHIDAIPVCTNIWWLNPDGYFFSDKSHGAQLASIASFFSRGFQRAYIAASFFSPYLHVPWGSHPLLDNYFSTAHFQIVHHGVEMTRLAKTKLAAEWPVALQNIRVCANDNSGSSNCGTCEKCIRTMITLVALGKLGECRSFPRRDVDVELLEYIETYEMMDEDYQALTYRELLPLLEARGRGDLCRKVESILSNYQRKRDQQ